MSRQVRAFAVHYLKFLCSYPHDFFIFFITKYTLLYEKSVNLTSLISANSKKIKIIESMQNSFCSNSIKLS